MVSFDAGPKRYGSSLSFALAHFVKCFSMEACNANVVGARHAAPAGTPWRAPTVAPGSLAQFVGDAGQVTSRACRKEGGG